MTSCRSLRCEFSSSSSRCNSSNIVFRCPNIYHLTLQLINFLNLSGLGLSSWENLILVSRQFRALSVCIDVQAGLVLYWWQRLITFGSSRLSIKLSFVIFKRYKKCVQLAVYTSRISLFTRVYMWWQQIFPYLWWRWTYLLQSLPCWMHCTNSSGKCQIITE